MKIVSMNEGTKIDYSLRTTKLTIGDAIMLNLAKYQRDWPVIVDVMADADGNLVLGEGRFYVAQVEVPPMTYTETEEPAPQAETGDTEGNTPTATVTRTPNPLDTDDVTLRLWSIDGINII